MKNKLYLNRFIEQRFRNAIKHSPVIVLNGPRQSGKSTLVKELLKIGLLSKYITCDDILVYSSLLNDPYGYLKELPHGTIIDEIQRLPQLFITIKQIVDEDRQNGRFVLTGSANVLLLPKISESLAGRMDIISLAPLTEDEIKGHQSNFVDNIFDKFSSLVVGSLTKEDIIQKILDGGFPEPRLEYEEYNDRLDWYKRYLNTLLTRDVKDITNIEQLDKLPNMLSIIASNPGSILNLSDLSRLIDLKLVTLNRYYNLLKALYMIDELEPYFPNNFVKRIVKSPKVYLSDCGLISGLLNLNKSVLTESIISNSLLGKLLENFVINQIRRQSSWSSSRARLYYMRTVSNNEEIDLILENSDHKIIGIEIKLTSTPKSSDWLHLRWLKKNTNNFEKGIVLYLGNEIHRVEEDIYLVPISCIWS
jgi:uncharacterized protein